MQTAPSDVAAPHAPLGRAEDTQDLFLVGFDPLMVEFDRKQFLRHGNFRVETVHVEAQPDRVEILLPPPFSLVEVSLSADLESKRRLEEIPEIQPGLSSFEDPLFGFVGVARPDDVAAEQLPLGVEPDVGCHGVEEVDLESVIDPQLVIARRLPPGFVLDFVLVAVPVDVLVVEIEVVEVEHLVFVVSRLQRVARTECEGASKQGQGDGVARTIPVRPVDQQLLASGQFQHVTRNFPRDVARIVRRR